MTWMVLATIASPIITLVAAAFMVGEYRQQLRDHGRRIDIHDERLDANDNQLAAHAEQLAEQRGFIRGVEASGKMPKQ